MVTEKIIAPKTLFMILGSESKEHEMDFMAQKSTWLSELRPEQDYLVLRGSKSKNMELKTDTLYLPVQESTRNILEKTILGFEWALSNYDFQFLIRTNVSTYFPVDLVGKYLSTIDPDEVFFGGYIDFCDHRIGDVIARTGYVTGTAIVMTRKCVELLVNSDWRSLVEIPDDLAITLALRDSNTQPKNIARNNLSFSHVFWPCFQIRLKTPSFSNLASIRMQLIHNFFFAPSKIAKMKMYLRISLFELRSLIGKKGELKVFFMHVLVFGKRKLGTFAWNKD